MSYEPKLGDGALFQNEKKSDKSPDRTGYVIAHRNIEAGEKLNLAGWIKGSGDKKFLSIRMSDVRGREESKQAAPKRDDLDDTPF